VPRAGGVQQRPGIEHGQHGGVRGQPLASVTQELPCATQIAAREMVEGDRDLDEPLQRLTGLARRALPHRLEDFVHLEEEARVPQGGGAGHRAGDRVAAGGRTTPIRFRRGECMAGVRTDSGRVRCMHREQRRSVRVDQVLARQALGRRSLGRGIRGPEPDERRAGVVVIERLDGEMGERIAQRQWEHDVGGGGAVCYRRAVPLVYTASVAVRHHELDAWGRVYPAAHLRTVAEVAVEASAAAGFGPAWYDALGAHWIVRRTRARFLHPVGRDAVCTVRTWVADFRRVRSRRCYEVYVGDRLVVDAESDWVLIDVASGRPRRIPAEVERTFDAPSGAATAPREDWDEAVPPVTPRRIAAAVRFTDLDSLAHVNNAAYLDVFSEAALAPLAQAGWSLERFRAGGIVPSVVSTDIEYLDAVVWGEALEVTTWMVPAPHGMELLQHLGAPRTDAPRVRARTRWEWHAIDGREPVAAPHDLAAALDATGTA